MPVHENNHLGCFTEKILEEHKIEPVHQKQYKPTIIFDFDGVINSYKSGWKGVNIIPDEPVDGIREAITEIRKEFKVVVVSSRCYLEGGIPTIKAWLDKYNILVDDVTGEKPPAIVQIDDRAITFDGDTSSLLNKIKSFKTWYGKQLQSK